MWRENELKINTDDIRFHAAHRVGKAVSQNRADKTGTDPAPWPIIHVQDLSIESIQSTCYPPRIGLETQADKKVPTSPKLKIIGEKYQKLEVEAYQNIRDRLEGLDINGSLVVSIQNF